MIDIAKILAQRKVVVTIVTTPLNAIRFSTPIDRAGLPKGCENTDSLPSPNPVKNFVTVASMLQQQLEQIIMFEELKPHPSCIISDRNLAWTADTAFKFGIPRILFDSTNCFNLVCSHNLHKSNVFETVLSNSELFTVPGLPDQIGFTRAQLPPRSFNRDSNRQDHMSSIQEKIREAEGGAYGVLVNSCEELEPAYVQEYRKTIGEKIWCIGPVSLCNKDTLDMAERGKKGSIDETQCLKWLDSWPPRTVIYACFGSLNRLTPPQLVELGLGLEVSNKPFIWVIRGEYRREETEKWLLEEGFEERVKGRGLLIRGWAPQLLILSHPAIGGFITHCGWNSTLEGICGGIPMITWPLFEKQFYNEKFIVQVLEINWGKKEERRERVGKVGEIGKRAIEEGGSSYLNMALLVEDIMQLTKKQTKFNT
ncbi:hypothetical protein I3843_09G003400 [Carya illinoinensis]|uniref:Glycosyltransferase n=1 Tax=Carya illinoinensis TaxID=32201 RepID=A0A8T1PEG0_CARIL|nr:hypothetical protein I3760_09G003200 [Carya illinoinensis]KAG6640438.1 hypothetical protein CIPAW_09G003500 [Carya illinoinensis]KAG7961192.1 hypothetical protein I3843_09G003400 [Carya illinoinensis]